MAIPLTVRSSNAQSALSIQPLPEPTSALSTVPQENVRPKGELPSIYANNGAAKLLIHRMLNCSHQPKVYVTPALLEISHKQAEQPTGKFFPAGYIPRLKDHPKGQTGSAIANPITGKIVSARDSKATVTAQSTTKLYMAALLMILKGPKGENELFETVGKQPSMDAFNADSRIKEDPDQSHKPLNPFINIGALATTNRVWELLAEKDKKITTGGHEFPSGGSAPEDVLVKLLRELTGNEKIAVDEDVAESERLTGDNNRRLLGNVIDARRGKISSDNTPYPDLDKDKVADSAAHYFRQCAIRMSPEDHAKALWGLEHKINPETGQKYLTSNQLAILKDLTDLAGNYNQSPHLTKKTGGRAIAKSGVGGTQIGWIRSKQPGQPDIPFGVISEGLNNFGNPKAAIRWIGFLSRQNLAFKESQPFKRVPQKMRDTRKGTFYTPEVKISPREASKQLMKKLSRSDEATLKRLVLAEMTEEAKEKIFDRSERGFYLKPANPTAPLQNGKKLLTSPDTDGVMRTYTLDTGHHIGGHGEQPEVIGGGKIVVSITPEDEPFIFSPRRESGVRQNPD